MYHKNKNSYKINRNNIPKVKKNKKGVIIKTGGTMEN